MSADDILGAFSPDDRTMPAMLQRQARRYGSRTLFKTGGASWRFDEAPGIAARFAGTLAAARIRPGDRVAIMCSNRPEFLEAYLGCAWLGAIAVPINIAARGSQLRHILNNSGARLLVIETELLEAFRHVDLNGAALERIWLIGGGAPASFDRIPTSGVPPRNAGASRRDDRSGAVCCDSLYVRDDRPVERRVLSACAIFLVGISWRPQSRTS